MSDCNDCANALPIPCGIGIEVRGAIFVSRSIGLSVVCLFQSLGLAQDGDRDWYGIANGFSFVPVQSFDSQHIVMHVKQQCNTCYIQFQTVQLRPVTVNNNFVMTIGEPLDLVSGVARGRRSSRVRGAAPRLLEQV